MEQNTVTPDTVRESFNCSPESRGREKYHGVYYMEDTIGSLDVHDDDFGVSVQAYGSIPDCDGDGPALDGRCRGQAHCILGIH